MGEYLLFRLYGPMAAWGDIAVGEFRPSFGHPSKSAVLGLLGAALGIRRDEESVHQAMGSAYGYAVRVDAAGTPLRDYHTAQVPPAGSGRDKRKFASRKDELTGARGDLATILSSRDYRCDALYTVCVWPVARSLPYSLTKLAEALAKPQFALYLGRKSCPLASPLQAQVVHASNLREAFRNGRFQDAPFLEVLEREDSLGVYWEGDQDSGFETVSTIERRDAPRSRRRWQFAVRTEHYGVETPAEERGG